MRESGSAWVTGFSIGWFMRMTSAFKR